MLGSLSKGNGDGNENGKKAIGLDWKNNNFVRASRFFVHVHFLPSLHDYDVKVSRFMEDVNKRTRNLLSHSELGYGSGEFNSRRVRLHLAKPVQFKRPAFHAPKFIAS